MRGHFITAGLRKLNRHYQSADAGGGYILPHEAVTYSESVGGNHFVGVVPGSGRWKFSGLTVKVTPITGGELKYYGDVLYYSVFVVLGWDGASVPYVILPAGQTPSNHTAQANVIAPMYGANYNVFDSTEAVVDTFVADFNVSNELTLAGFSRAYSYLSVDACVYTPGADTYILSVEGF